MSAHKQLKTIFENDIKDKWFHINRNGDGARGDKLESLLGKPVDNISAPDYMGIELKTKKNGSSALITLFTKVPEKGNELRSRFGTRSTGIDGLEIKRLNATFGTQFFTSSETNEYNFRLRLDSEVERLYIDIADKDGCIVSNDEFYWNLETLKNSVETKLKKIAVVGCETMNRSGIHFVKYTNIGFVEKLSWAKFLDMVRNGKIKVDIRMGQYASGKNIGRLHDHGTGFRVSFTDLVNTL